MGLFLWAQPRLKMIEHCHALIGALGHRGEFEIQLTQFHRSLRLQELIAHVVEALIKPLR